MEGQCYFVREYTEKIFSRGPCSPGQSLRHSANYFVSKVTFLFFFLHSNCKAFFFEFANLVITTMPEKHIVIHIVPLVPYMK